MRLLNIFKSKIVNTVVKHILPFILTFFFIETIASNPVNVFHNDTLVSSYENMHSYDLSFDTYKLAMEGYLLYKSEGLITSNIIAIIDFDLPSTSKRLFILNVSNDSIIYSSLVAHGKNSGGNIASDFSNVEGSHKSSIGFFKTKETYTGKHGTSLRLDGLEKGINDNARDRNIVIHKADYVSDEFIAKYKRLGRSHGCPAIPVENYDKTLDLLNDEILLYIHSSSN